MILLDRLKPKVRAYACQLSKIYERVSSARPFYPILYVLLFVVTFLFIWTLLHPRMGNTFTQDSYAYYLLGRNLFDGLGYTTPCARDFSVEPIWPVISKSFPPLHPVLVGFVDMLTGLKIHAANVVSYLYIIGTIVLMFLLGRDLDRRTWLFFFFAFVVFVATNKYYREASGAGRSIPGMMLFFLLTILFFFKTLEQKGPRHLYEVLTGIMAAGMLHERFDQTLFCIAFIFFSGFIFKLSGFSTKQSLIKAGTIAGVFIAASLPWAIRNMIQFGAPFASDNTGSTTSTFRGLYCCSFWLPGREPPNLFTHPEMWLNQRLRYLSRNFGKIVKITYYVVYIAPIAVLAMWRTFSFKQRAFLFLIGIHFCTTLFTISLTPYGDNRYFSLVHLNLNIALVISMTNLFLYLLRLRHKIYRMVYVAIQIAMVVALIFLTFSEENRQLMTTDLLAGRIIPKNTKEMEKSFQRADRIVSKYMKEGEILAVKPNAESYTYFTGRETAYYPSTVGRRRRILAEWTKAWSIDFYLFPRKIVNKLRLQEFVVANAVGRQLVDADAFLEAMDK
jgi:hypothetical protein